MLRKPVAAALFDMDGLLLDTEVIYIEAMQAAAHGLGLEMSLDFCHSMVGVAGPECNLMIEAYYGEGFNITEFREHFSDHRRRLMDGGIPLKPGVVELMDFLAGRGLPLAVATSAGRVTAEHHLGRATASRRWRRATMSNAPSRIPTSISKRRAGSASPPSAASPSRTPTSAWRRRTPPAPWPSWCPTCCSPCPRRARGRSKSSPTCTPR